MEMELWLFYERVVPGTIRWLSVGGASVRDTSAEMGIIKSFLLEFFRKFSSGSLLLLMITLK